MKRRFLPLGGLAVALTILVHTTPASSTVMRYLSLEEHLELSELVVRAKVGASSAFVGEGRLPFTDTTLEVLEVFKGAAPDEGRLRVRQLRGEVGGRFRAVPGDAEFVEGEEVILFLHGLEGGLGYLTALGQSKYEVERPVGPPAPGGEGALVVRDLSKGVFHPGGAAARLAPGVPEAPVDLGLFRQALNELREEAR